MTVSSVVVHATNTLYGGAHNRAKIMAMIQEEKFKRKDEKKKQEIMSLGLNKRERKLLDRVKNKLQQEKDGTALKQCLAITANIIYSDKMGAILDIVLNNRRKNKRLGITEFEED